MLDGKIVARLRVTECKISPFEYDNKQNDKVMGEVMQVRASGYWASETDDAPAQKFPASLHVTVYPGCEAVPLMGDIMKVTIERAVA